jgi:hypothetical protein
VRRRAFLALAGSGAFHTSAAASAGTWTQEDFESDVGNNSDYRMIALAERVDDVFVERRPRPDGRWLLSFVNWLTTPEGDRDVLVASTHDEPGFHIDSSVPYRTAWWAARKSTASLMVTFEVKANIRVFRHIDRGKEVVLEAIPSR